MGRPLRPFHAGIYHLGSHGSDDRHLFLDIEDRLTFLDRLVEVFERFSLRVISYALLGNHYHGIVSTPGGRISEALQQLHASYSRRHNRRRNRSAHLFRAHGFGREIQSDEDLLWTCRYVAHNPVEAGLAQHPFTWPWSSTAATAGLSASLVPLDLAPIKAALGDTPDWRRRYRELINGYDATASSTRSGMSKFA
jgi:putative transposase